VDGQRCRQCPASTLRTCQEDGDVYVSSRARASTASAHGHRRHPHPWPRGSPIPNPGVEDDAPDYQVSSAIHPMLCAASSTRCCHQGGDSTLYGQRHGGVVSSATAGVVKTATSCSAMRLGSYQTTPRVGVRSRSGRNWDMEAALSDLTTDGQRPGAGAAIRWPDGAAIPLTPTLRISVRNR